MSRRQILKELRAPGSHLFLIVLPPLSGAPWNLQSQLFVVSLAGQQQLCCPKDDQVKALVVLALTIYGVLRAALAFYTSSLVAHLINE